MTVKPSQIDALSRLLQQSEQRHKVISQNVANLNTPGFRTRQIQFEDAFRETRDAATQIEEGDISETTGLTIKPDGNNVDLDRELGSMTKNALHFETFSHLLVARFSLMRSAITGN